MSAINLELSVRELDAFMHDKVQYQIKIIGLYLDAMKAAVLAIHNAGRSVSDRALLDAFGTTINFEQEA
jgi:hypothetical protein